MTYKQFLMQCKLLLLPLFLVTPSRYSNVTALHRLLQVYISVRLMFSKLNLKFQDSCHKILYQSHPNKYFESHFDFYKKVFLIDKDLYYFLPTFYFDITFDSQRAWMKGRSMRQPLGQLRRRCVLYLFIIYLFYHFIFFFFIHYTNIW